MFDQMVDAKDGEARALALQMMTLPESDIFIANASTSDQATPAKDEARNVQPASDVNERDKPKIKSVNLQAMGDTGRDALPEASPIRLNIPSLAVNVPPARPLQVVSQEVNKSDETGETPKDKIALIEKSKERMQAGPGEVFWRLAHHHHAIEIDLLGIARLRNLSRFTDRFDLSIAHDQYAVFDFRRADRNDPHVLIHRGAAR